MAEFPTPSPASAHPVSYTYTRGRHESNEFGLPYCVALPLLPLQPAELDRAGALAESSTRQKQDDARKDGGTRLNMQQEQKGTTELVGLVALVSIYDGRLF